MLNVAAITAGQNVPSARFRVRQYLPTLLECGVSVTEFRSLSSKYPPTNILLRPAWGLLRLAEMAYAALQSHRYEVTLLQREMLSTFATLEGLTRSPRVLDVDDAIHLHRGGRTAQKIASHCDRIICGNNHLAEVYRQWNSDVVVLPTAVDAERYSPRKTVKSTDEIVLGWIGTSGNLPYLQIIEPAIVSVLKHHPRAKVHVVCDRPPQLPGIEPKRMQYTRWSSAIEVEAIQSFDIGLMPLEDTPWARGKCSFKMLQYMACGVPVAVAPVGMNNEILQLDDIGFGATSLTEWVDILDFLLSSESARLRLGLNGRQVVLREYSLKTLTPLFASYLGN